MNLNSSDRFEIVCRHKDTNPSNLNKVFESYGCNTLEAKVPVVNDKVVEKLRTANHEQQSFGTLALKSESAANAMDGRMARTRNRPLSIVEVGRETLIAAGKERERSPVDRTELDNELDEYMKITAKIRAEKKKEKEGEKEKEKERLFKIPNMMDENISMEAVLERMTGG